MSVDMHVQKFLTRLKELDEFRPQGRFEADANELQPPAWKAVFSGLVLLKHTAGYRLPTLEQFIDSHVEALRQHPGFEAKFASYVGKEGQPSEACTPGFLYRASQLYESGMAELFLYAALVEAVEDRHKMGVVLFDPRVDWKLKADAIVLCKGCVFKVDAYYDVETASRHKIARRRDDAERLTKQNTSASSHWNNAEIGSWTELTIVRTERNCERINGFHLFSPTEIDRVLDAIYAHAGIEPGLRTRTSAMMVSRPGR